MGIIKTAMLAFALAGGASGNGLEKTVEQEEKPRYVTINGATYRQRPPGASCDPTLYGTPVKEEPKPPVSHGVYFALALAGVATTAILLRKRHDELIEKYKQQERSWDFFGAYRSPVVDYEIDRKEREF